MHAWFWLLQSMKAVTLAYLFSNVPASGLLGRGGRPLANYYGRGIVVGSLICGFCRFRHKASECGCYLGPREVLHGSPSSIPRSGNGCHGRGRFDWESESFSRLFLRL
jgi:hypothetical protein